MLPKLLEPASHYGSLKRPFESIRAEEHPQVPFSIQPLWALPIHHLHKMRAVGSFFLPPALTKQSCRESLGLGPQRGNVSSLGGTGGHTHQHLSTPGPWGQPAGGDSRVPPQMCKSEALLRPLNSRGLSCLSLALCPCGLWLL